MAKVTRRQLLQSVGAIGVGAAAFPLLESSGTVMATAKSTPPPPAAPYAVQSGDADYYVLDSSNDGDHVRVAMHFPVPSGTNLAGLTYSQCLVQDTTVPKQSVVPWVSTTRQAALDAGTVVEYVVSFETNGDLPPATKRARLDQRYLTLRAAAQQALIRRYWAWGYERSGL